MDNGELRIFFAEEEEVDEEGKNKNLGDLTNAVIQYFQEISLAYPPECYDFIERCLRVKNYDVKKTKKLIPRVGNATEGFKDIFDKHDPQKCAMIHNKGVLTVLKSMDEFGHKVWLYRVGQWHPKDVDCEQFLTTAILFFVKNVGESKVLQRNGVVAIMDMKNFGIEQLRGLSIKYLTKVLSMMNDSAPGKIKTIHLIFHPKIFGPLFNLIKPFIKEKMSKRIHFHGDSTSSLQQFVKPEILPESLGGKLGEVEAVDEELVQRFIADQSYCSELNRLGFPKK